MQTVFLQLLEASARSIVLKEHLERKLHFGVIVSLLLREEFRFHHMMSHARGKGQFNILAGYVHQLSVCTLKTVDCLQGVTEYSDPATINSCMKILAIAFIRLPNFRDVYVRELEAELEALKNHPEQARSLLRDIFLTFRPTAYDSLHSHTALYFYRTRAKPSPLKLYWLPAISTKQWRRLWRRTHSSGASLLTPTPTSSAGLRSTTSCSTSVRTRPSRTSSSVTAQILKKG